MQFYKKYPKINGFTLVESMLGIMVISLVAGSIMLGITTVEKKLFNIRLKEQAFEILRNYTNFLGSRIAVGDIPSKPSTSGLNIAIYKNEVNNIVEDIYTANMNYEEVKKVSKSGHNGEVYSLYTYIVWPNESELKDTLHFYTHQIKLTN